MTAKHLGGIAAGRAEVRLAVRMGFVAVAIIASILVSIALTPPQAEIRAPLRLEDHIPRDFGDWVEKKSPVVQVALDTGEGTSMNQPYDQVVMRAYQNSNGEQIYLAVAWGENQRQEVKVHRPDLCYVSQGYRIESLRPKVFEALSGGAASPVLGKTMVAFASHRGEAVMYWIRIGDLFSENAVETRLHILKEGLGGRYVDGVLVRASMPIRSAAEAQKAWPLLEEFLTQMVRSTSSNTRPYLLGQTTQ